MTNMTCARMKNSIVSLCRWWRCHREDPFENGCDFTLGVVKSSRNRGWIAVVLCRIV
uniref:Uncharacterized protein n=1 Tax=Physcomitrium patens TaxID=3218 RepID=A0A2K1KQ17_PHYPA|nr:hypothetical protein PHYPA_006772 [Physcomitrium patens]